MNNHTRTNTTLTVQRTSAVLPALVLPARPEIVAYTEIPATKAVELFFLSVVDLKEQDILVEGSTRYKVVGAPHFRTVLAAHTEALAEVIWGIE